MAKNLLAVLFGLALAVLLLEVGFRLVPTSDATFALNVDDANPYLRYPPDREVRLSFGRFFEIANIKRTNNLGFFADQDFVGGDGRRKLALIGDSYVEAKQVANAEAVHARLQHHLGAALDVYGLGFSGSPLSQYLAYAELADATFAPELFVFVVIPNDYDEAMLRYHFMPGQHYFTDDGRLVRVDAASSPLKRLLRHSAVVRYLALNLKVYDWLMLPAVADDGGFVANMPRHVPAERMAFSKAAVDHFLAGLEKRAGGRPVLLVIDAIREAIYAGRPVEDYVDSFVYTMHHHLMARAAAHGFHVLDLQPVLTVDYADHGKRFEFPIDSHWNARGHDVAARAIADTLAGLGLVAAAADAEK